MSSVGAAQSLVGTQLGDFELRERIGKGSFGTVYLARQRSLDRDVVVKVRRGHSTERDVERFLREAQLASMLEHPFAAHVYDFGAEPDGALWIAMEYVRGTSLADTIALSGPLELEALVSLLDDIANVVDTAHEKGIVHGDLKPSNIMVTHRADRALPKLLDFGLAWENAPEKAAAIVGSPPYMAPELWLGEKSGPASDLYALGATVFELLRGERPFDGRSLMEIARAHGRGVATNGSNLDEFFTRALARDPADRFSSARELFDELCAATGVRPAPVDLPRLDAELLQTWLSRGPTPIALSLAEFDSAINVHQALSAALMVRRSAIRIAAVFAIAARARLAAAIDDAQAIELLRKLATTSLDESEWLTLISSLCRQYSKLPGAFPIPELARLFAGGVPDALEELDRDAPTSEDEALALLTQRVGGLEALLDRFSFLLDYSIVHVGSRIQRWAGLKPQRGALTRRDAVLADSSLIVASPDSEPLFELSPLGQVAEAAPGLEPELFIFDGGGLRAPRLLAFPHQLERRDSAVATWFEENLEFAGKGEVARDFEREPYRGLAPFRPEDAEIFFGREREAEALRNRIRARGFAFVVGPSGSGKSSLVAAGVIRELEDEATAVVLRPGSAPIAALVGALESAGIDAAGLSDDPSTLGAVLSRSARSDKGKILVVIDQFEELFTLGSSSDQQLDFARAIESSTSFDDVWVVATLRDDFLMRAEAIAPLRHLLATNLQLIGTPSASDLTRIVLEPAKQAGYSFDDPTLVAEMVSSVEGEPSGLALLSFTASKLWELRDRKFHRLLRASYDALGGVGGALAHHAEEVYDGLSSDERLACREIFAELITNDGTRATRTRAELEEASSRSQSSAVIEKLVAARLLTAFEGEDGALRIEVIHEALLSAWPRLESWRQHDAQWSALRDQLRQASAHWHDRDRSSGLLWRGDALLEYKVWRARYPGGLSRIEEEFAAASLAEAGRGRRRRVIAVALVVTALAVGLVFALIANRTADRQRQRAEEQTALANAKAAESEARQTALYEDQGRQQLLAGEPRKALALLGEARRRGGDSAALDFMIERASRPLRQLIRRIEGHTDEVYALAVSPDGKLIATGGHDKSVRVWTADGAPWAALSGHEGPIFRLAFSPDNTVLSSASMAGTARLWDPIEKRQVAVLEHESGVWTSRFSPDSLWLVTASSDSTAAVWDARTGKRRASLLGHTAMVRSAVFDPPARRVVTASHDGTARLWNATTGKQLRVLRHADEVVWAEFDPRGELIVTASSDRTGGLWRPDGTRIAVLGPHPAPVLKAQFSPAGNRIVTASRDGQIRLWSRTGRLIRVMDGHDTLIIHVAFQADGTRFATAAPDGQVHIWSSQDGRRLVSMAMPGRVRRVEFSPDGETLASVSTIGAALWRANDVSEISRFALPGELLHFDTNSGLLAVSSPDGLKVIEASGETLFAEPRQWAAAALGGDKSMILAVANENALEVFDLASKAVIQQIEMTSAITRLAVTNASATVVAIADGTLAFFARGSSTPSWSKSIGADFARLETFPGVVVALLADSEVICLTEDGAEIVRAPGYVAAVSEKFARVAISDRTNTRIFSIEGELIAEFGGALLGRDAISPDGLLAVHDEDGFHLHDVSNGARRRSVDSSSTVIERAAFDDRGALIATPDSERAEATIWDAAGSRRLARISSAARLQHVVFLRNPRRLMLVGYDKTVRVLRVGGVPDAELSKVLGCSLADFKVKRCGELLALPD